MLLAIVADTIFNLYLDSANEIKYSLMFVQAVQH